MEETLNRYCPYCYGEGSIIQDGGRDNNNISVMCLVCSAYTSMYPDVYGAVHAWNNGAVEAGK